MSKKSYIHLLRSMAAGDVLYLPCFTGTFDASITSIFSRNGGKVQTAIFVATNLDPAQAHRVVRITCIQPLQQRT